MSFNLINLNSFKKSLFAISICMSFISSSVFATASEQNFKLANVSSKDKDLVDNYFQPYCGKPVVVEFFSYSCYGCYKAEESFNEYLSSKPSNVEFKRVPVVFNTGWNKMAKMYYAYEKMGVINELHALSFIWVQDQLKNSKPIDDESIKIFLNETLKSEDLRVKLEAKNFNVSDYMDNLKSTIVNRDNKKGERLFRAFQITSTPSVVVNNKYVITLEEAKNYNGIIKAINERTKENTSCNS